MILAIETATNVCSVALVHKSQILFSKSLHEKNVHSEQLMVLIDELMMKTETAKTALDAIAVSIGPGSFTGLRIGLSTAKGLAYAIDRPIISIPTLDGIAEAYRSSFSHVESQNFCAMIDAKRNEAFYALYSIMENDINRISDYSIKLKDEIIKEAEKRNAKIRQPEISASSVGLLAERCKDVYTVSDFSFLEPLYLRDFVATLPKK
jgi:tRNA threonylcarbamoyladenosine biosynthesis protein TsaB